MRKKEGKKNTADDKGTVGRSVGSWDARNDTRWMGGLVRVKQCSFFSHR